MKRILVGIFMIFLCLSTGAQEYDLHKGLNVDVDASVFASFGKHAPHGAGFAQRISALYADSITSHLYYAVGIHLNNVFWKGSNYHDAGLDAMLGYRFNEHWEAHIYAQKSIKNNYDTYSPYRYNYFNGPMYKFNNAPDRLGIALRYSPTPAFSFQVSVEGDWYSHKDNQYFDTYNYPVPKN